ncbi:MAG: hypothetical protein AMXMBFR81_16580 [Chthonomonas sp.]|nr:hypothetical protein [Fimbriimonadaceae bacterium]
MKRNRVLAALGTVLLASPVFSLPDLWGIAMGHSSYTIRRELNGVNTFAPPSPVPGEITFTYSGGTTTITLSTAASRKRNQPYSTGSHDIHASYEVKYRIFTNDPAPVNGLLVVWFSRRHSMMATVTTFLDICAARACASVYLTKSRTNLVQVSGEIGMMDASNTSGKWFPSGGYCHTQNVTWVDNLDGTFYADIVVPMGLMHTFAVAEYWGPQGGNMTVSAAQSHAKAELELNQTVYDPNAVSVDTSVITDEETAIEIATEQGRILGQLYGWFKSDGRVTFDMAAHPAGNYRIYLTPRSALRKRVNVSYTPKHTIVGGVTFKFGDVDYDNDIDSNDADYIASKIGKTASSADWHWQDALGRSAYLADLDRDGAVTIADHTIALANLGQTGDQ